MVTSLHGEGVGILLKVFGIRDLIRENMNAPRLLGMSLFVIGIFCSRNLYAHGGHYGDEEASWFVFASSSTVESRVSITTEGNYRVIRANGIPNHPTGSFPNRNNPHRITPQDYTLRIPLKPQAASKPVQLGLFPFGVALNGVVFDPSAAEWWNGDRNSGWQYEPMLLDGRLGADQNNAHVQPTGAYHYHAMPTGLLNKLSGGKQKMVQLGWAADGFPIYGPYGYSDPRDSRSSLKKLKSSYRIKKGERPNGPGGKYDGKFVADYEYVKGAGDLDECNGRFGVTPEFPEGIYYYVITEDFPFIPRQFKGTPDPSFLPKGRPNRPGRPPGPPPGRPRPQAALPAETEIRPA